MKVTPAARKAPKLCPATPLKLTLTVSSGRPALPYFLAIRELSMAPTLLSEFRIRMSNSAGVPESTASRAFSRSFLSYACASSRGARPELRRGRESSPTASKILEKSRFFAFQNSTAPSVSSRSLRPTASSIERRPRLARISRVSPAMKRRKFSTCSGFPLKHFLRRGSWVATPTGQEFSWHLRIITQPRDTSIVVANPNSSAPRSAPITTSRPVLIWPSTCTRILSRRRFRRRVCWTSASPSSHGSPACLMLVSGEAPVPPSWPLTSTTSALPLATPAAIVPTPTSETSFTDTRAASLALRRS